jgi:hypothetical protein
MEVTTYYYRNIVILTKNYFLDVIQMLKKQFSNIKIYKNIKISYLKYKINILLNKQLKKKSSFILFLITMTIRNFCVIVGKKS